MSYRRRRKQAASIERKLIGVILITALLVLGFSIRFQMLENRLERRVANRLDHMQHLNLRTLDKGRRNALTADRDKERRRQQAIRQQQQSTCSFWMQQLKKEDTVQNRAYRDTACSKVGLVFR